MSDDPPRFLVTRTTVEECFAEGTPLTFINASTLSLHGRPVEITDGPPPEGAVLICAPPSRWNARGSVLGACDECADVVVYMPSAPQLKRVCWACARRQGWLDTGRGW